MFNGISASWKANPFAFDLISSKAKDAELKRKGLEIKAQRDIASKVNAFSKRSLIFNFNLDVHRLLHESAPYLENSLAQTSDIH